MSGRAFLPDHEIIAYVPEVPVNPENDNYGNEAGLALADSGALYLIGINQRGYLDPDNTYFELVILTPR